MKRYTVYIKVRVTVEEKEYLLKKADESGCIKYKSGRSNLSDYLRSLIFSKSGLRDEEMMQQLRSLQYELRKIGVNVNQIARKINSGFGDYKDVQEIKDHLRRIEKAFSELSGEVQKAWRSQN